MGLKTNIKLYVYLLFVYKTTTPARRSRLNLVYCKLARATTLLPPFSLSLITRGKGQQGIASSRETVLYTKGDGVVGEGGMCP